VALLFHAQKLGNVDEQTGCQGAHGGDPHQGGGMGGASLLYLIN
jgi:hypothetical protein